MLYSSPLESVHEGAVYTDFAGWKLPLRYGSTLQEHAAVRNAAGLFDISHMAEIFITGDDAPQFLNWALASRFDNLACGQARYSFMLNERGGIVDDLIVYRLGEFRYMAVANAANRQRVFGQLQTRQINADKDYAVKLVDATQKLALMALQGPKSAEILTRVSGIIWPEPGAMQELGYYRILVAEYALEQLLVARTGYTGEDGFELYIKNSLAPGLWREILSAGSDLGVAPCGLACRDSLRLEAGMPLYGHELNDDIRPDQAGLARVVAKKEPEAFVGGRALARAKAGDNREVAGSDLVLVGLVGSGRRAARQGYAVLSEGEPVGRVSSGLLSPTLGVPIAMAYVPKETSEKGRVLEVDVRGQLLSYTVVELPFYKRGR